jgi:hypothetical protein
MVGSALDVVSMALAAIGALLGILANHRRGAVTVIVHLAPAAAMASMVTVSADDGAVPYLVAALLLVIMFTLAISPLVRPTGRHARILTARAAADLAATAVLLVLLTASPAHVARGSMDMTHGEALPLPALIAIVLIGWVAITASFTVAAHRGTVAPRSAAIDSSGAVFMVAGMSVMSGMVIAA